jgi:hypothetical protein
MNEKFRAKPTEVHLHNNTRKEYDMNIGLLKHGF